MKRSSDPATSLGKAPKKPKLSSAATQKALGILPPPPEPPLTISSSYVSPDVSNILGTRLRPRPQTGDPKPKASRKSKPPVKIQPTPNPPPTTTLPTPSLQIAAPPPKATPQPAKRKPPLPFFLTTNFSSLPPAQNPTAPPPQTQSQQSKPKNKPSLGNPTVPIPPPPITFPAVPLPVIKLPAAVPPQKIKITKVPPKPKPLPVLLPPKIPQNPSPPPSVTPEAAKILVEISPTQFTPTFLQSNLFEASILPSTTPEFALISTYISNSQPHPFHIQLDTVLNIKLRSSTNYPLGPGVIKRPPKRFCMMLWHGTKPLTVAPILENGFRCPLNGNQMFGQGIYFADRVSKSAKYCTQDVYCTTPKSGEVGYVFLCEVTLGKCYNAKNSNSGYKSAPQITKRDGGVLTFDSLKCTGENIPDRQEQREVDGVIWPMGQTVINTKFPSYTVMYNEFIVYNPDMVDIRYLAKVKFSCCEKHAA